MLTDDLPYSSFTDPDIVSVMRNEGVPWRKTGLTGKNSTHSGGKGPFLSVLYHHIPGLLRLVRIWSCYLGKVVKIEHIDVFAC
jgi:hypothetical protein